MDIIVVHTDPPATQEGHVNELPSVLLQIADNGYTITAIRYGENKENDIILGERIDIDVIKSIIYPTPVVAPDFIVATPTINANPILALDEAIAEADKPNGDQKSIGLIVLSMAKYLKAKKDKL